MRLRTFSPRMHPGQKPAPHHPAQGKGAKETTYILRPTQLMYGALACVAVSFALAGSASYLVVKNGMMAEATAERTELELQYQDRIDRLRSEVERLTSRQLVDRENVEIQVLDLLRRQQDLNQRHAIVADLVERAESVGIYVGNSKPLPPQKPGRKTEDLAAIDANMDGALGGESELIAEPVKALGLRDTKRPGFVDPLTILEAPVPAAKAPEPELEEHSALDAVEADIAEMGVESTAAVDAITAATESRIDSILGITKTLTPGLTKALRKSAGMGGPFVALTNQSFANRLERADNALTQLRRIKFAALRLPIQRPVLNASVSSDYGPRLDPFLNKLAMHTGMDFKAAYGARVYSTAPGTVLFTGWHGGYGKMIEVRHANGFITRYAHLSRIQVAEGDHVLAGDTIGNVGSTGRSTGPHLHYEIRRADKPVDPVRYLSAGDRLSDFLL